MGRKTFEHGQVVKIRMLSGEWKDAGYDRSEPGPRKRSKTRHYARMPDGREHLVWPSEIRTISEHYSKTGSAS